MQKLGKFVLGAFLGGIVGSAAVLLLAPVSGMQMRRRIYNYCTNIRSEVKNAAEARSRELRQELLARQNKL